MTTPHSKVTTSSKSSFSNTLLALPFIGLGLLALWALIGVFVIISLNFSVPLSTQDLQEASWLSSPTTSLHFTTGPLLYGLGTTVVIMGLAIAVTKGSLPPLILGSTLFAIAFFCLSEEAHVRIGILDDVVKVGCYIPESRQCLEQLGLDSTGAPSIYPHRESDTQENPGVWSGWYKKRRTEATSNISSTLIALHSIPGLILLRAPFYLPDMFGELLKAKLIKQRSEVAELKAAHQKAEKSAGSTLKRTTN